MPGWSLEFYEDPWEGPHVHIVATLPDAYRPGETIDIGVRSAIPPLRDASSLHYWLTWRLTRIFSHEVREFLKVDGKAVFDPHALA